MASTITLPSRARTNTLPDPATLLDLAVTVVTADAGAGVVVGDAQETEAKARARARVIVAALKDGFTIDGADYDAYANEHYADADDPVAAMAGEAGFGQYVEDDQDGEDTAGEVRVSGILTRTHAVEQTTPGTGKDAPDVTAYLPVISRKP